MKPSTAIVLALLTTLPLVSCRNSANHRTKAPTAEEVLGEKNVLAESILATIDHLAEKYIEVSDSAAIIPLFTLTDEEKMVKPDYLLAPEAAGTMLTKSQKTSALAIYIMENIVRQHYGMATDETSEAIQRLAIELNYPINGEYLTSDSLASDKIRKEYEKCRNNGDIPYFWQFQDAILVETEYLIAQNPDIFLRSISDDDLAAFNRQWSYFRTAVRQLAEYDEEMSNICRRFALDHPGMTDSEVDSLYFSTVDTAIGTYRSDKSTFTARRNALIQ